MMEPKPALKDGLYLGDNGRCFCFEHAGASAKYSGCDISGQKVQRVDEGRDEYGWFYQYSKQGTVYCSRFYSDDTNGMRMRCEECEEL